MSKTEVANERKEQIVKATVDCITRYGYHNFSMQDVAKHAGVSKGIIHYYFLNKDELMMSVLDRVVGDIEAVLSKHMQTTDDSVKKLEGFVQVCFDIVKSTKEYYQVNMDFWTQINQKDEVRSVIARHYNKFRVTCANVIEEGVKKNIFKEVNPMDYASLVIALIDGISLQWLFDDKTFDYPTITQNAQRLILEALQKK